jgi:hypothetical protein
MSEDRQHTQGRRGNRGYEEIAVAAALLVAMLFFRLRLDSFVIGRQGGLLGPEFWPGALLSVGIVLSAIYLVLAIVWARRASHAPDDEARAPEHAPMGLSQSAESRDERAPRNPTGAPDEQGPAESGSVLKLIGGFVLLAAYIYLLAPIGFVPATVLFSVAFLLLVGERRWWVLLAFPVGSVTVLLGMFTQLLTVSLPRGTGIFLYLSTYLY